MSPSEHITIKAPDPEYAGMKFSVEEYKRRYDLVFQNMKAKGIDALMVRVPENICYITGHETSGYYTFQTLILSDQEPVLVIRWIEEPNAFEYSWVTRTATVKDHEDAHVKAAQLLEKMGLADKVIGIELSGFFVTVNEFQRLTSLLPGARLVDSTGIVEEARMIKSAEEVAVMRDAAGMVERGVQAGFDVIEPGANENDIAAVVHAQMIREGGEWMSLPPYILAGPRTRLSHGTWRNGVVEEGQHVYFEVSACKYRYSAAIMRSMCIGEPRAKILRPLSNAVHEGLHAALDKVRAGVVAEEVDTALRSTIAAQGFGDIRFGEHHKHRCAYSIGLNFPPDWGEGHIISIRQGEKRVLEENMTFHMVPDVRIWPLIGYGCSTTFRVTKNGYEELTSAFPHELLIK
jgi:Xaa-Pro dipeptidase